MKRLILLLFLAPAVFAQHEYIVPMIGFSPGIDADHFAESDVLNPTARTAHIRVTGVYPVHPDRPCNVQVPAELAPRSRGAIAFDANCPAGQLAAVSIESDQRLVVTSRIHSILRGTACPIGDVQQIDGGTEWIPFAAEALTRGELDEETGRRANLLLVNPNAFALRVRIQLRRTDVDAASEETLVVAPRSTVLHPLTPVPVPQAPSPFPRTLTGDHEILLAADDRFWAGVSSLDRTGGNHFEEAVPLEP